MGRGGRSLLLGRGMGGVEEVGNGVKGQGDAEKAHVKVQSAPS